MSTEPDLLIVGGGAIGLCIAEAASRRGLRVVLLERDRPGTRASWAGAGMLNLRPWPKARPDLPDYHDLLGLSMTLHAQLAARLKEEVGLDTGYRACGALELIADAKHAANAARLLEGCRARNVQAERLTPAQARELEPGLDPTGLLEVLHLPQDGQVRNPHLLRALIAALKSREVPIREGCDVADLWVEAGRVRGVITRDGARIAGAQVVVAAGAWTCQFPELVKAAPRAGKIEPVRGQIVCFQARPGIATRLLTAGHHYLVPRADGVVLAGSTTERTGYEVATTPAGQGELRAFAEALLPELKRAPPLRGWAEVRPGLKGRHPLMGPVPGLRGCFIASGHYRNGLGLAPVTGEIIAALAANAAPPIEISPWKPKPPEISSAPEDHEEEPVL